MDYRAKIQFIRGQYLRGELTHTEAKAMVLPLLKEMNAKGQAVAKKFGRKFHPLTFGYVFR